MTDTERQQIDHLLDGDLPLVDRLAVQKLLEANVSAVDQTQGSQTRLVEGEALCLSDSPRPRRVRMIPLSSDARTLQGTIGLGPVIDVADNISSSDVHRYYTLLPGGMGEGARIYTSGYNRSWSAMPGAPFPSELAGADAICTFSADKREDKLVITVILKQPCELYVLADARAPAPSWLRGSFVDTGLRLRSGPWVPRAEIPDPPAKAPDDAYVPHAVWTMQVMQPGPVVLGSPRSTGYRGPLVMYGLAVKAMPRADPSAVCEW